MAISGKLDDASLELLFNCIAQWESAAESNVKLVQLMKKLTNPEGAPPFIADNWEAFEEARDQIIAQEETYKKEKSYRTKKANILRTTLILIQEEQIAANILSDSVDYDKEQLRIDNEKDE